MFTTVGRDELVEIVVDTAVDDCVYGCAIRRNTISVISHML